MHISIGRPTINSTVFFVAVGALSVVAAKAFEFHTETLSGALFTTALAHIIGTILGVIIASTLRTSTDLPKSENFRNKAAVVGYSTLSVPLFVFSGWLLWQPWLWLTR